MFALTLGQAKTFALLAALVLAVGAIGSAWMMKEFAQKAAMFVILGLLAVLVWTQRASLQECADKIKQSAGQNITIQDTTCSFFGRDIQIKTPSRT
jgi:hypothetical protein